MATDQTRITMIPKPLPVDKLSFRAQWANLAIRENLSSIQHDAPKIPTDSADVSHIFPTMNSQFAGDGDGRTFRVGIVGAGVAGLFTAMIFDYLKDKYGVKVEYEILEASERVGGRLSTYTFPARKDQPEIGPHDYYDVGAMRFPQINVMKRTFDLFKVLKMEMTKKGDTPQKGNLIPYYFTGLKQPALYNGKQIVFNKLDQDPTANDFNITSLPVEIMDKGSGGLVEQTIQNYKDIYNASNPTIFWGTVKEEADHYSVRQYLTEKAQYNYNTIEFLETLNFGTRWYDQALSEMVLESMDFDSTKPWWCVEGGTQQIAEKMQETLKQKEAVKFNKTVAALSYTDEGCDQIDVTVKEDTEPRRYDAVFNSATLGAMQHMQLEGLNLNWGTKSAIRSLGYGASCKVGIRFKTLWWKQEKVLGENCVKLGGQGKTDLPIRTCVYPSYNVDDKANLPGVLLASYTWSQDADRIGSLISRNSPEGEEELKELLIHDLARLHANKSNPGAEMEKDKEYDRLHKIISEAYLDHYAYNWHNNPRTVGAFAYFGPGQFKNMYPYVIRNDGKHIIVGEAASAHHAWVVGALESAVRGVYQFLNRHSKRDNAIYNAAQAYESDAIKEGPYGPLPAEFNRTEDVKLPDGGPQKDTTEAPPVKPSPIGDFARMGVLFEKIRLQQGGDKVDPAAIRSDQVKSIVAVAA